MRYAFGFLSAVYVGGQPTIDPMIGTHPGSLRRSVAALSVASLGLVLGHWLTYALDLPDPSLRADVLASTGHAYLSTFAQLASVAAVAGLGSLFLGTIVRAGRSRSITNVFAMLAVFQIAAFLGMEVVERLAAGASIPALAQSWILPIGAVIQSVLAAVGALVIHWLLRTAERAGSRALPAQVRARGALVLALQLSDRRPTLLLSASGGIRGPPVSSTR
jgi:hypothetical protein